MASKERSLSTSRMSNKALVSHIVRFIETCKGSSMSANRIKEYLSDKFKDTLPLGLDLERLIHKIIDIIQPDKSKRSSQKIHTNDSQEIQSKDSQDIHSNDSQEIQSKDSQEIQSKDSQDIHLNDSQLDTVSNNTNKYISSAGGSYIKVVTCQPFPILKCHTAKVVYEKRFIKQCVKSKKRVKKKPPKKETKKKRVEKERKRNPPQNETGAKKKKKKPNFLVEEKLSKCRDVANSAVQNKEKSVKKSKLNKDICP